MVSPPPAFPSLSPLPLALVLSPLPSPYLPSLSCTFSSSSFMVSALLAVPFFCLLSSLFTLYFTFASPVIQFVLLFLFLSVPSPYHYVFLPFSLTSPFLKSFFCVSSHPEFKFPFAIFIYSINVSIVFYATIFIWSFINCLGNISLIAFSNTT